MSSVRHREDIKSKQNKVVQGHPCLREDIKSKQNKDVQGQPCLREDIKSKQNSQGRLLPQAWVTLDDFVYSV
jgi:hypothetical protein